MYGLKGSNGFQPEGKIDRFLKLILKHLKYKTLVSLEKKPAPGDHAPSLKIDQSYLLAETHYIKFFYTELSL